MTDRPILFTGAMVRAILAGAKTQTRRILSTKVDPRTGYYQEQGCSWSDWHPGTLEDGSWAWCGNAGIEPFGRCYYGAPGDRLWVKETILRVGDDFSKYSADGVLTVADAWPWQRPVLASIHCPRGLSRLTLEVTGVRVERLRDITEEDAKAEGTSFEPMPFESHGLSGYEARIAFQKVWDSINEKRAPWSSNPWVWVVEFRRLEQATRAA